MFRQTNFQTTETLETVLDKWKAGDSVWSASLGGIGPAYEQCIQLLLFEICARWDKSRPMMSPDGLEYSKEFDKHADDVCRSLELGMSGAQFGSAKVTAFQFMHIGYAEMMNKLPSERWIQVSSNFPRIPEANAGG